MNALVYRGINDLRIETVTELADLLDGHHQALQLGRDVVVKARRARADDREEHQLVDRRGGMPCTRLTCFVEMLDGHERFSSTI